MSLENRGLLTEPELATILQPDNLTRPWAR